MKEIIPNKISKCCSATVNYNQVMMEEYGGKHYICNNCKDNCDVKDNKLTNEKLLMQYTKTRAEIDNILYRQSCTSFEDIPKRLINKVNKLGSEILKRMN